MNFVSPERLIWLLAAMPIVVLYILRTRLRKQPVATLLFWDQLFDEKRQRSWWQRLRHWISLLLQLAFLGLIVAALVDPLWKGQKENARQVVIVLDNSASMQAKNADGTTRFEDACKAALQIVSALRAGDEVAYVTAGSSVRVVIGMTDFGPAVRDAINQTTVTDGPTKVTEAIQAACRLTRSPDRRDIVVLTDGGFRESDSPELQKGVRLISVGESADNAAITSLAVRRSLVDPIGYAAMIQVQNFGKDNLQCRLSIDLDDELVDVIPLDLEPGETWNDTIVEASAQGGILRATLDTEDALQVDNLARAVLPRRPKIPVTLVTAQPSLYIESVLGAIPLVELTTTDEVPETAPRNGFLVLHRIVPEKLPSGSVLAIDPQGDCDAWKVGNEIQQAIVAQQDAASPLMPHVQLINVVLPGARPLEMEDTATPLLTDATNATLMASLVRGEDRLVVLSADLDTSDLPLRIAFPVMMTNAVNWFLGQTGELQPALHTGQLAAASTASKSASSDQDQLWNWTDAEGNVRNATVRDDNALVGPFDRTGVFQLTPAARVRSAAAPKSLASKTPTSKTPNAAARSIDSSKINLAVNLCDEQESDLTVPKSPADAPSSELSATPRSAWFYLTFLAMGLIVGEWFLYQRRIVG